MSFDRPSGDQPGLDGAIASHVSVSTRDCFMLGCWLPHSVFGAAGEMRRKVRANRPSPIIRTAFVRASLQRLRLVSAGIR